MSIPGLQLPGLTFDSTGQDITATSSYQAAHVKSHHALAPNTEYRFEVPFSRTIKIKVTTGTAELFGSELAPNREYSFTGVKAAIFTYNGCTLEVEGQPENDYVGEETEMPVAANLHFALEEMRDAVTTGGRHVMGPRVLFVGPDNSGKSTVMRILASYAVKMGRQPVVVNLNPREGLLSIPGSLTATALSDILDIEEVGGWGSSPISGPSAVPVKMPLVYHYGCSTADDNKAMYKALITRLALAVTSRLEEDSEVQQAGCLVDTPGAVSSGKGGSYEHIQHIASEFSVNVIVVTGSERLYKDMTRIFSSGPDTEEPITVVRIAKSEGCVDRDETYMQQLRHAQVQNYFRGTPNAPLFPYTQVVDFSQLSIYKIRSSSGNTASFNPGDDEDDDYDPSSFGAGSPNIFDKVTPSLMLQNALLAITTASANDRQESIRDSSVLGYMYVDEIDEAKKKLKLLIPVSGRIPGNAIVVGDWPEGIMDL